MNNLFSGIYNVYDFLFVKGGPVDYLIFLCSLIGVTIFIERLIFLRNSRNKSKDFLPAMKELYTTEGVKSAYRYCNLNPSIISNIFKVGLRNADKASSELRAIIESAGNLEIRKLEKNLVALATLGGISPLLGFLGTVSGMIKVFMVIEAQGGSVNASVLAGGIWEAMITTAFGLCVAIPLNLFYNYLLGKVEQHIFEIEESSIELLDILTKRESNEI
ncbi:MAG: MotA/TolQ/ExbB proton channel family protein [Candidatus Margulisbacteria bacterium]|nr:MotA/TolQ/ExbB proton channel family protein [Candidatus Margulisiibacteriota bacterium]